MTPWDPITLGEYPKGFCGLVKGLTTIAHVSPLIIRAEQRNLSITKDLNHLPLHIKDILTVYMVCVMVWWVYRFWLKEPRQIVSKTTSLQGKTAEDVKTGENEPALHILI